MLLSLQFLAARRSIIESAIAQVNEEFSNRKSVKLSKAQEFLRAFKVSTPQTRAQGMASLKFERLVSVAERKILQEQRRAKIQSTESMAEALAMEVLHTPGSILTQEEVETLHQESNCSKTITTAPDCDTPRAKKHRLADGTCNNLKNPTWGAASTRMSRLIEARYDDGFMRTRGYLQSQGTLGISVFSPPNPSPRVSSLGIIEDREAVDPEHTHILMQWGQFMDHDLDAIPEFEIPCPEGCTISSDLEGACAQFAVPRDDEEVEVTRTAPDEVGCHGFHRSLPACQEGIHPREQVNAITHFIDGSMVYHHDPDVEREQIRAENDGLLETGPPATSESLPDPLIP